MKSKYKPRLDSQTSTVYFPLYTDAVHNIEKTADPYRICGFSSAENRTRTDDPFITSEVLYQLSYFGIGFIATSYIISPFLRNFNCFLFFFLHMHSQLIIWNLNSFFIKCQFYLFKKFPSCIPVFFHLHISTDS